MTLTSSALPSRYVKLMSEFLFLLFSSSAGLFRSCKRGTCGSILEYLDGWHKRDVQGARWMNRALCCTQTLHLSGCAV